MTRLGLALLFFLPSAVGAADLAQWETITPSEIGRVITERRLKRLVPPPTSANIPAFKRFLELPEEKRERILRGYVRYKEAPEEVRARALENARKYRELTRTEKLNLQERWLRWKEKR